MSTATTKPRKKTLRERQEERADFSGGKRRMTAGDLLATGLAGSWKDIPGIEDSEAFARMLRKRAQERHRS
jgi:hypothetical protein